MPLRNTSIKIILFLFCSTQAFAQNFNEVNLKLGISFYQNEEYDKAMGLLEDVYKDNQSMAVYTPLLATYIALEDFKSAEKIILKKLKKKPYDPIFQVDHGYVLALSGNLKKSENVYKDAIKKVHPITHDIIALSNSFQRRNETAFAIETYLKGKKLTPNYGYQFELGELYYQIGDIEGMVNEYLGLLEINRSYLQNVQNALNTTIYSDLNGDGLEILNKALLRRIQRYPDEIIYSEMIIWHYLQQKDFKNAIAQTKALDRRYNEGGKRMIPLGETCLSNKEYDLAMNCYQYLIDLGKGSKHYINARVLMTETIREKIISAPYTNQDLMILEENYIQTLNDVGRTPSTINLQIGLADLWAFYLDKNDTAISLMNSALKGRNLNQTNRAKVKMKLADIYLSQNEIWEASLLYSQVEKDFKYEALGDEAKYKNARIYFFTGDYNWAKAQLDILKGSTSKLISNDALRLSLLISDNLAFDTVGTALKMYARASLKYEQGAFTEALTILESMEVTFIVHSIMDEILFLKYQILFRQQKYEECEQSLQKIVKQFPSDILADEAFFRLAELYDYYLNNADKAKEMYRNLIASYPASIYIVDARNRYRELRGDELN